MVLITAADVPARLRPALLQLLAACSDDLRVRAAWLEGSFARGEADAWSDIGLHLIVEEPETFGAVEWLGSLMPLVLADAIPGLSAAFICLTRDWVHIDLNLHSVEDELRQETPRQVLVDKDALIPSTSAAEVSSGPPFFPAQQTQIFLYLMGNAVTAFQRGDLIALSQTTVMMRDGLLIPLMLAENGILNETGAKRVARHLTTEQQDCLERLPAIGLTEIGLREAQRTLAVEYLTRARRLADVCHAIWPTELELAATRLWRHELGIDL
ncbi:aminoglycoside 6-adenylyltransferase [Arthrobacter sp. ISL-65]|uniref:aminoglycoside 6-adenylyltransferase n=1 Tax=Arthrobacter sp. ISL-65 TaxID=2819112 RepID=UPI001BE778EC|nr:aminoglycoside 6-adenylyltransferase [Arthrobacter sp. ISL-65]MBT2549003.1 aminoglycoside 6-adenylyltransferase [Arthrobacter sp. ISL-65]